MGFWGRLFGKKSKTVTVTGKRDANGNFVITGGDVAGLQALMASVAKAEREQPKQVEAKADWTVPGGAAKALPGPLTEPTWQAHLEKGRVVERATFAGYPVVVIDPTPVSTERVMKYRFRAFVLPAEGKPPVLAVNAERSPFGTSAYGVHRGAAHVNYGEAPDDVDYDVFRARAKQILGEELLGIPAG